jgi:hypothetical protein
MSAEKTFKVDTGNIHIDNTIENGINQGRLQAAFIHRNQILKRVEVIRTISRNNNHGDVDIQGAALSQIEEMAEAIIHDYTPRENHDDE